MYFQARYATAAVYIVQNVFDFADPIDVDALQDRVLRGAASKPGAAVRLLG